MYVGKKNVGGKIMAANSTNIHSVNDYIKLS